MTIKNTVLFFEIQIRTELEMICLEICKEEYWRNNRRIF